MTHKEILTAFRNGNTKVILTCQKSGEEIVATIDRIGPKHMYISWGEYYVEQFKNYGDINCEWPQFTVIYEGA